MANYVITIARGYGSGGLTIGKMLAKRLGIDFYDMELLRLASEESGINIELFNKADEHIKTGFFKKYNRSFGQRLVSPSSVDFTSDDNLFNYQAKIIRDLAQKQDCIIIGRCADYILREQENVVRLYFYADHDVCVKTVTDLYGIRPQDAEERVESVDRSRAAYYKYYTGGEWNDETNYDLCINTSKIGFEKSVDVVLGYLKSLGILAE